MTSDQWKLASQCSNIWGWPERATRSHAGEGVLSPPAIPKPFLPCLPLIIEAKKPVLIFLACLIARRSHGTMFWPMVYKAKSAGGLQAFLPDKRHEVLEKSTLSPPSLCLPSHTHPLPSHLEMWPCEDVEPGAVAAILSP